MADPSQPGDPEEPENSPIPGFPGFLFGAQGGDFDPTTFDFSQIDLGQVMRLLQSDGPVNWEIARQTAEAVALEGRTEPAVSAGDRAVRCSRSVASRGTGSRVPVVARRSPVGDQAAASIEGHMPQAADRFASTRARRAAPARAVRSAGTASPVPKYISSRVCPRNAESGSTRLCSWT